MFNSYNYCHCVFGRESSCSVRHPVTFICKPYRATRLRTSRPTRFLTSSYYVLTRVSKLIANFSASCGSWQLDSMYLLSWKAAVRSRTPIPYAASAIAFLSCLDTSLSSERSDGQFARVTPACCSLVLCMRSWR